MSNSRKIVIKKAPKNVHLRNKDGAGIAQRVYEQLEEDYSPELIKWVLSAKWTGPLLVPLSSIDFSERASWSASDEPEHVKHFEDQINDEGQTKPVILINEPNKKKLFVADGRHRLLAYRHLKVDPLAYIAEVGGEGGAYSTMHEEQEEKSYSNQK